MPVPLSRFPCFVAVAGALTPSVDPLPPKLLPTYSTEYIYYPAGPSSNYLHVEAYNGNSALSDDGTEWYTRRVDWIGDAEGGPETPVVSIDVIYKGNLSEGTFAFWDGVPAEGTNSGRGSSGIETGWRLSPGSALPLTRRNRGIAANTVAGSAATLQAAAPLGEPVCIAAALPLPGLWVGLDLDWIAGGGGGDSGVAFVGFENVTLPGGEVVEGAQHWQQAGECRDVWLSHLPPDQGPWPPLAQYQQPRLLTFATAGSAPACNAGNGTVVWPFSNVTWYLSPEDADQASSLFAPPPQCFGDASGGGGGGGGGSTGTFGASATVPILWLVVGALVSALAGLGVGLLIGIRRQWRQIRAHAQDFHAAYTKSLLDAI